MIPRFTRTRNGRRRRLTLHHAASLRRALEAVRETSAPTYVMDWLDVWHGSGWGGTGATGVGPYPRCLNRRRRVIAEMWED